MKILASKARKGSALVEFAFSATLIILLGVGSVSFGLAVQNSMVIADAATAGALYGANSTYNNTQTASMQNVAVAAGAGVKNLTASATYWCTCTAAGSAVSCSSACGSDQPLYWVQVTTTATYNNFFSYFGMPSTFTLQSSTIMLVQ